MLVEDNIELAEFLISSFADYFKVKHCLNGRDAISELDKQPFDLIISDVMMPVMNGFEFCQQVKSDEAFQHIPVILLTAKSDIASQKTGFSLQADDYISKPFNTDILIQKIINMVNTYQAYAIKVKQQLLSSTLMRIDSKNTAIIGEKQNKQAQFITKLQEYLTLHYSNTELKVGEMASHFFMSEKTFTRKIQAITSSNITSLLREYRLNQATRYLTAGAELKNIGFDCGFNSVSYFGRCFKQYFGITPAQYQQQVIANHNGKNDVGAVISNE